MTGDRSDRLGRVAFLRAAGSRPGEPSRRRCRPSAPARPGCCRRHPQDQAERTGPPAGRPTAALPCIDGLAAPNRPARDRRPSRRGKTNPPVPEGCTTLPSWCQPRTSRRPGLVPGRIGFRWHPLPLPSATPLRPAPRPGGLPDAAAAGPACPGPPGSCRPRSGCKRRCAIAARVAWVLHGRGGSHPQDGADGGRVAQDLAPALQDRTIDPHRSPFKREQCAMGIS